MLTILLTINTHNTQTGSNPATYFYVEHDCGGVGWGNSIRGLYNAAAMAAMFGRRLIVTHAPFNRLFLPPNEKVREYVNT